MNYRYEYMPNPKCVVLHTPIKLVDSCFVDESALGTEEERQLLSVLKGCRGATKVSIRPYSISIQRGGAFERDEVLDAMLELVKMWAKMSGEEDLEWEQLPTLRTDVRYVKCPECKVEEEREIARAMREFDTLEW